MSEDSKIYEHSCWSNRDNSGFYENVPISKLQELASSAGIDTHCDLDIVKPYIFQANSILEVGAGYGRVLDYLINVGYGGKITAVERSASLYRTLQENHSLYASIIQGDLLDIKLQQHFDLVLWLWAGIADFTATEQARALKKLSSLVADNGSLVLDTLATTVEAIGAVHSDGQQHVINLGGEHISVYGPSTNEIEKHARNANFTGVEHVNYKTTANRNRVLHILRKHNNSN